MFLGSRTQSQHQLKRKPFELEFWIYLSDLFAIELFDRPHKPPRAPLQMVFTEVEGRGVGDTHITGRHFEGDTHITSDLCAGIHISRGYTYHCDTDNSSWQKP